MRSDPVQPRARRTGAVATDAMVFDARILSIAERYPEEAQFTPREMREHYFSPAQNLAWTLHFGTGDDLEAALAAASNFPTATE